jgi:hypothetical protein
MELTPEIISEVLAKNYPSREEMVERMLLSDGTCGILETWDYGRWSSGTKIVVTYELDSTIPYGTIHRIVKDYLGGE